MSEKTIILSTTYGNLKGLDKETYNEFRGIRYAEAGRWERPQIIHSLEGEIDATKFGACCWQRRGFEDDEVCNAFYHKEFRAGMTFTYSEDCQYLNIYAPKNKENCPVVIYIHGGSFTGGSADEGHVDGRVYAERDIVFVAINYRLGPYGFASHPDLYDGVSTGNYGLFDQQAAIEWVIEHIASFGGNPEHITLLGQSAGAMSVDLHLSNRNLQDKISGAILMSGAGIQRAVAKPVAPEKTAKFWNTVCKNAGVKTMDELKKVDEKTLFYAWSDATKANPLNTLCTLPVADGNIVNNRTFNMDTIPSIPIMVGVTITDMMTIALEQVAKKYTDKADTYMYCFNRNLPGDDSGAWHSCDLLYSFGTLGNNWRPFTNVDYKISKEMIETFAAFIRTGNPDCDSIVEWEKGSEKPLHFGLVTETSKLDTKLFLQNTFGGKGAKF